MKEYHVEVTETLSRVVKIEASSAQEAMQRVREMYRREEIVLGDADFVGTEFKDADFVGTESNYLKITTDLF